MDKTNKIYIAGHNGMLGYAVKCYSIFVLTLIISKIFYEFK